MDAFICTACGTQFPPSNAAPQQCVVCEDERQFIPPRGDIEALTRALVQLSHMAVHLDGTLAELDINPLMVLPEGKGVKAVDGLVLWRE